MAERAKAMATRQRRSVRQLAWTLLGGLAVAGISACASTSTTASHSTSTRPVPASTTTRTTVAPSSTTRPVPSTTSTTPVPAASYELGSAATTMQPPPNCSLAVGGWTAALGPVSVTVNADGPTDVTVTINDGAASQVARISDGQDTQQFDFPSFNPSKVRTVKVTASSSPQEQGGSCIATGSPTA